MRDLERTARRDRQPQHPDLARQREHDDARARRARRARTPSPIASHASVVGSSRGSSGASASAAASAAARPAEAFPTRPFAPKHAHGAPVRPARIAPTCTAQRAGHQQRGRGRRRGQPGRRHRRRARPRPRSARPTRPTPRAASGSRTSRAQPAPTPHRPASTRRQRPARAPGRGRPRLRPLTGREGNSIRARPDASSAPRRPQETLRCRSSAASSGPEARRTAASWGSCPCCSTNRATFVLKLGALTHTSTVCPARNFRCFLVSDVMIVDAPLLDLARPSASCCLNGHFLPLHRILTFQPFGNCCVTCSDVSVKLLPLHRPLVPHPGRQRRERLREPIAVLVEVVALDLDRPGPDRRVRVVAVLTGEEPVPVAVDPARPATRSRRRRPARAPTSIVTVAVSAVTPAADGS